MCLIFVYNYIYFVLCLCRDWFCGLTWESLYMWEEFWNVPVLLTEFDCPEVTLTLKSNNYLTLFKSGHFQLLSVWLSCLTKLEIASLKLRSLQLRCPLLLPLLWSEAVIWVRLKCTGFILKIPEREVEISQTSLWMRSSKAFSSLSMTQKVIPWHSVINNMMVTCD